MVVDVVGKAGQHLEKKGRRLGVALFRLEPVFRGLGTPPFWEATRKEWRVGQTSGESRRAWS